MLTKSKGHVMFAIPERTTSTEYLREIIQVDAEVPYIKIAMVSHCIDIKTGNRPGQYFDCVDRPYKDLVYVLRCRGLEPYVASE